MVSYDVLIRFADGSEKIIKAANNYSASKENECFFIEKKGYKIMIPMDKVMYIGRKFDLENESVPQ